MKTKTKKEVFQVYPISDWSVRKYGVSLYVNTDARKFSDGISLDVEDNEEGVFVGIGIYDGTACYYWNQWELAKQLTIPKFIAHNGRSDLSKLKAWGFDVDESYLLHDTQLFEHIIDSSKKRYGLKAVVSEMGIKYPNYEDLTGKKKSQSHTTLDKLDPMLVAEYNACDCYATHKLFERQVVSLEPIQPPAVPSTSQYFEQIEKPVSFIFQKMEDRGIQVDLGYLNKLRLTLEEQKKPIEEKIYNELGKINLNSTKQLLGALHAKEIYPELKGKGSISKPALERFRNVDVVGNLLRFSELETLLSSFVQPYLERNQEVVHPNFNQCGTRTGRPSCSNPNLLQIPRKTDNGKLVRNMFISRKGHSFGDCDFGQIEPRVLAHLSKDGAMLEMFKKGTDFHDYTSQRLKISREVAKVLNLSVGYRATYKSVSQQLKCSWDEAQKEIDKWWSAFPGLYDWEQQLIHISKKKGYFTTLFGRHIKVEDLDHGNEWRREAAERQLINNITQASAAEIMKKAMIAVDKLGVNILVQVYDELLIEEKEDVIESAMEAVIEEMTHCVTIDVPLTVDAGIGRSWSEAKA